MADNDEEMEEADWITTYADAITLLMAFFVMMLTFAKYDMPAYEAAVQAIKENISGEEQGPTTTEQMQSELLDIVYNIQGGQDAMDVTSDDKGVVIELASKAFYNPGSATIRQDAEVLLLDVREMLKSPKYNAYRIDVEGHTDDDPISTRQFPSNWELSAGRATGVVRFLSQAGIDSRRLQATAYAETRPKVPNRDVKKNPIRENQDKNRGVCRDR
jgi:chemotaxis protein MotB